MKKTLVTFWGYTDNRNEGLIYRYTFFYIIILIYWKYFIHLYSIRKKIIIKNSTFSFVA